MDVKSDLLRSISLLSRRIRGAYRQMSHAGIHRCILVLSCESLVSIHRPCFNHRFASLESECIDVSGGVFCLSSSSTEHIRLPLGMENS